MTSESTSGCERRGRPRRFVATTLACVALACGCRGDGYQTSIVTGTVTYKGKPVENLRIEFAPADGPKLKRPPATGITGPDGRYDLVRPGGKPGAVAGPNSVAFFMVEGKPLNVPADAALDRLVDVDVKPGESVHDFDLAP